MFQHNNAAVRKAAKLHEDINVGLEELECLTPFEHLWDEMELECPHMTLLSDLTKALVAK